jgi:hypothetical protein
MRQGRFSSIVDFAKEIERQADAKRDLLAPVGAITMNAANGLDVAGVGTLAVNEHAHGQISEYTKINRDYYRDLQVSDPELLAINVNRRVRRDTTDKRQIRTLDGVARAFLSPSYRPLDNIDMMKAIIPVFAGADRALFDFRSFEVTDRRLYLKIIHKGLSSDVIPGKRVWSGIILSNSEVRAGSIAAYAFTESEWCTNGATHTQYGQRKAHVGRAFDSDDSDMAKELFSDRTRQLADAAFFAKFADVVKGILSPAVHEKIIGDMRAAVGDKVEAGTNPAEVVEAVAVKFGFTENEKKGVLTHWFEGGDGMSRFGLANAITRAAQDSTDYDRATELETVGGDFLTHGRLIDIKPTPVKVSRRGTRRTGVAAAVAGIETPATVAIP